jgi:hypothetical protein
MGAKRVSEVKQELVGVPAPYGFESPASWISRAALSQGIRVRELLKFFGLSRATDFDMDLSHKKSLIIAELCGFSAERFAFSTRMFSSLRSIDQSGSNFLFPFRDKCSRYRYCPCCLQQQRVKHFPLHWRFKPWRYCPIHDCLMEDRCLSCGSEVKLYADLIDSGPDEKGVAFLDRCLRCEQKLSKHWMQVQGLTTNKLLGFEAMKKLQVGRSTLSALYHGYYLTSESGEPVKKRLKGILGLVHFGGGENYWIGIDNRELQRRRAATGRVIYD